MGLNDIRNYIIGTILFVIVVFAGVLTLGSFHGANPSLDSSQLEYFNESLSLSENVTSAVQGIDDSIASSSSSPGPLGWLNGLLGSVWNGVKATRGTLSFVGVAVSEISDMFGVPRAISGLIMLIPVVIIAFAIWIVVVRSSE